MKETIINAEGLVVGRMATEVARRAMAGESVHVVNAQNALFSGKKEAVVRQFRRRINLKAKGNPHKGPKFPRRPDHLVRRTIRGMLPTQRASGRAAFKRILVHIGVPKELEGKEVLRIEHARHKSDRPITRVGVLSTQLTGREYA